jgi:hypothetical protein
MSTPTPHRIAPPAEHCFVYVESTIPAGVTLDEWRRVPRGRVRRRRRWSSWLIGRIAQ